ncbi:ATP-binding protein [Streptomyces noursei]|uniref:ATP-binding protein n=1 Tax=Streptomyces noursei TaxID=1971 RepID=UPI000A7CC981
MCKPEKWVRGFTRESSTPWDNRWDLAANNLRDCGWTGPLGLPTGGLLALRYDLQTKTLVTTRHILEQGLLRWGVRGPRHDILLVATELVTNAIRHALREVGEHAQLAVAPQTNSVLCAVTDPSTAPPILRYAPLRENSGYGLQIVDYVSHSWGYSNAEASGKVVWARVPVEFNDGCRR